MKNHTISILYLIFVLFACTSDEPQDIVITEDTIVKTSVYGVVLDENNQPVEGATAFCDNKETRTDQNGFFEFSDISSSSSRTYIRIHKDGYFHGSKAFIPTENGKHKVDIQLLSIFTKAPFNSDTNSTVLFENGASIEFPKNAFTAELTGITYSGPVYVAAKSLSSESDLFQKSPGDHTGINAEGKETGLRPISIAAIELFAANGDPLQLTEGKTATIKFPVSDNQTELSNSISMWHFDEKNGYWKEEGVATLQDGMYVGSVSHFSFWGCYIPSIRIKLIGSILGNENRPMKYTKVKIKDEGNNETRYGYTNQHGILNANVPKGKNLSIEVFDICNESIYNSFLGQLNENTNLGEIIVEESDLKTIVGQVTTCEGDEIESGYIKIVLGNSSTLIPIGSGGAFEYQFNSCDSDYLNIGGTDLISGNSSPLFQYDITDWIETGNLTTCLEPSTFIEYTLNDDEKIVLTRVFASNIPDSIGSDELNNTLLYGTSFDGSTEEFFLTVDALTTGTYPIQNWFHFGGIYPDESALSQNTIEISITQYGEIGEYVTGYFNGGFIDIDGNNNSIEGRFNLILRE